MFWFEMCRTRLTATLIFIPTVLTKNLEGTFVELFFFFYKHLRDTNNNLTIFEKKTNKLIQN